MPQLPKKKEKDLHDWLTILTLLGLGVILVGWGVTSGWNLVLIVLGLVFGGSSVLATPEIRFFLKLTVNRLSGKEIFQIQEVRDSTVFQGGIHYHEAPHQRETPRRKEQVEKEPDWQIDETIELQYGEYQEFPIELSRGNRLVGSVEADERVTLFLVGDNSLRSFKDNLGFNYYWGREDGVNHCKVSYKATETRTHHFVVSNGYEDEEEGESEAATISVDVKLRVE